MPRYLNVNEFADSFDDLMSALSIPEACLEQTCRWIESAAPATLLSIGDSDHPLLARIQGSRAIEHRHLQPTTESLQTLPNTIFDLALILCALEQLPKDAAGIMLARMRDRQARRLLVMVRLGERWDGLQSHWQQQDLLAYGLRRVGQYDADGRPIHLYRFDLHDYKTVPDWLNARHWANPELWGKYRW